MMSDKQELNYKFFQEHKDEWTNDPLLHRKFGVICDEKLQGVFDTFSNAYEYARNNFVVGEFIIQDIGTDDETAITIATPFIID